MPLFFSYYRLNVALQREQSRRLDLVDSVLRHDERMLRALCHQVLLAGALVDRRIRWLRTCGDRDLSSQVNPTAITQGIFDQAAVVELSRHEVMFHNLQESGRSKPFYSCREVAKTMCRMFGNPEGRVLRYMDESLQILTGMEVDPRDYYVAQDAELIQLLIRGGVSFKDWLESDQVFRMMPFSLCMLADLSDAARASNGLWTASEDCEGERTIP